MLDMVKYSAALLSFLKLTALVFYHVSDIVHSILKMAHAQYLVKLARVLFSRDFFLQTNKLIVRTRRACYSSSGKQDGNWQRSVV